jgi:lipopolysaccharide exporter
LADKSSLARDVLKLGTGTASSQLIGVAAAPIIARLFSPEAFGGLAILAAVSGTIALVACLRYELAILLPEKDEDAAYLVWLSLLFVIASTAISALLIWISGDAIWGLLHATTVKSYAWLIPVNVFFAGISALLTAWNTRQRQFSRLMLLEIILRIAITGSQVIIGFAGFVSAGALMATTVFGMAVTTSVLGFQTWHESSHVLLAGLSQARMIGVLKRYATFPKFSAMATLLNSFSGHLPPVLLSGFISVGTAGQFSFSNRLLRIPSKLIGSNFGQAFFPRAAEARLTGALGDSVEMAITYLLKMSIFPCLILALIGKDLFLVAFGAKWAEAGIFTQILSPWLFAWFVASPLTIIFVVLEEQALELRFQIANVFIRGGSILIGGLFGSAQLAVLLFAISGMCLYGTYCAMVIKKSGASAAKIFKPALSSVAIFLPASLVIVWIRHLTNSPLPALGASTVLLLAYFSHLFRADPAAREAVFSWIANFRASTAKIAVTAGRRNVSGVPPVQVDQRLASAKPSSTISSSYSRE